MSTTRRKSRRHQRSSSLDHVSTEEMVDSNIKMLKTIFSEWEDDSLRIILDANGSHLQRTIDCILRIEDADDIGSCSDTKPLRKVRNPLPPDFLMVPGGSPYPPSMSRSDSIPASEMKPTRKRAVSVDNQLKITVMDENSNVRERCTTVLESFSTDALQRSRLDIAGAKRRIQDKEVRPVFDFLARASTLYQNGVVNGPELERLRELLLTGTKSFINRKDMKLSDPSYGALTEFEWGSLILRSKRLRPGLRARILNVETSHRFIPSVLDAYHKEYRIRVTDLESGISWIIKRRFREFYRLHKNTVQVVKHLRDLPFPSRKPGSLTDTDVVLNRLPGLQRFLSEVCSLVSPSPVSFLNGCALKELEKFLNVQERLSTLESFKNQPKRFVRQQLKLFVYRILCSPATSEGKACRRFLNKLQEYSMYEGVEEETAEFIHHVQSYVLQHRSDVLDTLISCLSVQIDAEELATLVRTEIEYLILIPILLPLRKYIQEKNSERESILCRKIRALRNQPQTFFEIPVEQISLSSWQSVVDGLKEMDQVQLPSEKISLMLTAVQQIHVIHKEEYELRNVDAAMALSGDDFLPIYIYALVHSDLEFVFETLTWLKVFCDPDQRVGEAGYYITSLEAAVEYVMKSY